MVAMREEIVPTPDTPPARYTHRDKLLHNAIAVALTHKRYEGGPPSVTHPTVIDFQAVSRHDEWRKKEDTAYALEKAAIDLIQLDPKADPVLWRKRAQLVLTRANRHRAHRLRLKSLGLHDAPSDPRLYRVTWTEIEHDQEGNEVTRRHTRTFTLDWTALPRTWHEAELRAWLAEKQEAHYRAGRPLTRDDEPVWDMRDNERLRDHIRERYPSLPAALQEIAQTLEHPED
jgi:hypothetical protein